MKYILYMLFISLIAFIILLWELLNFLWSFRIQSIKREWNDYCRLIGRQYESMRRAFRY